MIRVTIDQSNANGSEIAAFTAMQDYEPFIRAIAVAGESAPVLLTIVETKPVVVVEPPSEESYLGISSPDTAVLPQLQTIHDLTASASEQPIRGYIAGTLAMVGIIIALGVLRYLEIYKFEDVILVGLMALIGLLVFAYKMMLTYAHNALANFVSSIGAHENY